MKHLSLAVLVTLLAGASAPPDPPVIDLQTIDGLEVTTWATSPLFYNPTNIDVDAQGRIWVTEAVNYRSSRTRDSRSTIPRATAWWS